MRFRRIAAASAAMLLLAAALGASAFADEATAVAQARAALRVQDYAGAVKALDAEIAAGSKSAEVYGLRCLALAPCPK